MGKAKYQRILLKLSGEALAGQGDGGLCEATLSWVTKEILEVVACDVQVAMVIGGGNWMRGRCHPAGNEARFTADAQGMLATIMNALSLRDAFLAENHKAAVYSAIAVEGIVPKFNRTQALADLNDYRVVICAGGTGNPLVTTDTAASLRAIELGADILLKATNVDGVYSDDPKQNRDATLLENLTYQAVLDAEYGVMDLTAFTQCRDFNMPIRVYNGEQRGALRRVISGEAIGTYIGGE